MSDDIEINLDDPEDIGISVDDDSPISVEMPEGGMDGRSIHPAGEWSDAIEYAYLDLVTHEGSSYTAVRAVPAGTELTDTYYWQLTAEKGDPGDPGTPEWGAITGDLSDQTDLADALDAKADVIISSASGSIASFTDGSPAPVTALTVSIDPVQSGTGDPSPTNVRPISGHTSATVTRTGKNLLEYRSALIPGYSETTNGVTFTVNSDYSIKAVGTSTNNANFELCYPSNGVRRLQGKTVYIWDKGGSSDTRCIFALYAQYYGSPLYANGGNPQTIGTQVRAVLHIGTGQTVNYTFYPMVSFSVPDNTFEPYQGTSVTIDLNGTRYGGVIDVLTGEMTVTKAIVDLGTLTWGYDTTNKFFRATIDNGVTNYGLGVIPDIITSIYKTVATKYGGTFPSSPNYIVTWSRDSSQVQIKNTDYTSATDFKTAMSGVQLVYKLATPLTVQLTPSQLSTLLGQNNIWADTGDVAVTYRADTKLFIEKLTKPTEDDMTANMNISANTFFMVGNSLYYATSAIATGTTIVPGQNCTALSLAEALNNLNA